LCCGSSAIFRFNLGKSLRYGAAYKSDAVGELIFIQKSSKIEPKNYPKSYFLPPFTMPLGVRQQYEFSDSE
jgi:hypothetical protein